MSLVIKDADIIGKEGVRDVLIEEDKIASISGEEDGDTVLDADGKYLSPGLVNTHTHAAMNLFRGIADDMEFWDAWPDKIWPLEEKLTAEDVYWGTKLACLEMIKTGTVAFNDMYFFMESAADAIQEMGMKATLSYGLIDQGDPYKREEEIEATKRFIEFVEDMPEHIKPALGPHAPYTNTRETLEWCAEYSKKKGLPVHFHLAETRDEVEEFNQEHDLSQSEYLDDIGLLNERLIAAHCVWLEEEDHKRMAMNGVTVSHNPSSNMKLGVGKPMDYAGMQGKGVKVTLGTDSVVSNNNLDMLEEAKTAALQQKMSGDPTILPAEESLKMITEGGAKALDTGGGEIEVGKAADIILLDNDVLSTPSHDPVSNLIYSMNGSSVSDVVINGDIVMRDRVVKGEEEILKKSEERAKKLVEKGG